MQKTTAMTEGNIWKQLFLFSVPLILGNLFQQLYNTVDSIIVGNYIGSEALAAVGSSGSLLNLLIGFCVGASAGAGVVISQYYGGRDEAGLHKAVHTTIAIAIVAGILLTAAGILFSPLLLRAMGTPSEVFDQAVIYLQVYWGGILFNVIYNMAAGILNAVGNSKRSLIYLMIAAISNIFLDLLFVLVFKMGIVGAALATDVSQLLSSIFIILFLVRSKEMYRLKLKDIRFYDKMLGKILRIGLPTGIQNTVISFSNVIVQSSVNSFGSAVMAGFAAYVKIDGFNIMPVMSFSMAATTFTGQNIGAKRYDRVKKGMWVSLSMGILYTIVTGILLLLFAPQIIGVFTNNKEVVQNGVYVLKYFCPFYCLLAIMHELSGTIRGTGKTVEPMLIALTSLCMFRVVWIMVVLSIEHRMDWLFVVYPISWLIGAVLTVIYAWKGKWMPDEMRSK